jgi:Spy/CpxP family protein refolding chaperone
MLIRNFRAIVILLAIGTLLFSASTALAQRGPAPEKTDRHLAMLKDKLKLTDSQAEKIKSIMDESQKEAMAQREKHAGDPDAAAKFRGEHRKATDDKIKAVLNDQQKKEYDKIKGDFRQNMKERRGKRDTDRMGAGPGRGSGDGRGPGGRRGGR